MRAPDLSPEQLAVQARTCPVLIAAQTLAEWVGASREITTRGVLKPAAAVEACDLLGIEVPSRKPRSALDIDELMTVWAVACAAGFIELFRGRVTAGPTLQPWRDGTPDVVLAIWGKCALECLGLADETDELDLEYLEMLATLDDRGGQASLGVLSEAASCSCPECASLPWGPDEVETHAAMRALGDLGIAVLRGDTAELTPLGHWLTDFMFRKSAPPVDADAEVLVSELAQLPAMVAALMARPWLSSRTPAIAASSLLRVGESTLGPERLAALHLARECGPEAAPAWRRWATKDGFGAYARTWLAEQDGTEPADADSAWITVDALATMLDGLSHELPEAELVDVLPLLESSGHPAAPRLITLLNDDATNPTGPVARTLPVLLPRSAGYQIKVQLLGVAKPPVWRRLQVPDLTLDQLHGVIQVAMGWEDCHMHVFSDGRTEYGLPDADLGHLDERKTRLSEVFTSVGDKIRYTYDFGDGWEHDVVLENVLPADAGVTSAVCTIGKGACPPEDCGGSWGYEELKATLADPKAEQHEFMLEWLGLASGDDFDPKEFSVETVNGDLLGLRLRDGRRR